jgi:two-component system nitrate/nitrite response regulator NarP
MTDGNALIPRDKESDASRPTNSAIYRILLVDDHTFFRAGTRRILEDEPDFEVVGEASNGAEALAELERCNPDAMVLDVGLAGMGGIAVCEVVRRVRPTLRIVVLTGHGGEALVRAFDRLGVQGYFLKSNEAEVFVAGLRKVCNGQRAFCKEAQGVIDSGSTDADLLSPRELEVLYALAEGRRNSDIAQKLNMAETTVEYHIRHLFAKLGASSRSEVIVKAQRLGWLDSQEPLC